MAQLEFKLGDLEREIEFIAAFAKNFITAESPNRLAQFKARLGALHSAGGGRWSLTEPIVTIPTNQYSKGRGQDVWGEVSSTWDLKRKGGKQSNILALSGIASSRVSIMRARDGQAERMALWRMEIGDENAPGPYFHVHVEGDTAAIPFPDWLEVPRLPGLLPTPPIALEFTLGELFQGKWAQHVSQSLPAIQGWGALQKARLEALFEWQLKTLTDPDELAVPWSRLKRAKPTPALVQAIRG